MALEPIQQFKSLIEKSGNILIFIPENPNGDAIASAWGATAFFKKRGISSVVAFRDEFREADKFGFLPRPEKVSDNIYGSQDFLLLFNTKYNNITAVRTERADDEFRIFITPEKGSIDPRDFSFVPAKFKYDLLLILGATDKESLGKIYEESPDIFFEVPIVNIDCQGGNENFGQLNLVDLTASSVSEALADLLLKIAPEGLDETVSECLLSGIISATESFQKKNTTPRSLQVAALLMEKGADQQKINRFLFKSQPFNLLKLWGRSLVSLKWDEPLGFAWSALTLEDFVQSRTLPSDIPFVLDKLQDNYSAGKIFAVFFVEQPGKVAVTVQSAQAEKLGKLAEHFKGEMKRGRLNLVLEVAGADEAAGKVAEALRG